MLKINADTLQLRLVLTSQQYTQGQSRLWPGPAFAGRNTTHGKKKADVDSIKWMRDDLELSFSDEELEEYPFIDPSTF